MKNESIYIDTHKWIPVGILKDPHKLVADLTVENLSVTSAATWGQATNKPRFEELYQFSEDGEWVRVPRGYQPDVVDGWQPSFYGPYVDHVNAINEAGHKEKPWPIFRRTLRENQLAPAQALKSRRGLDALLCLGCGKGKTSLALWQCSNIRGKTLIIVDRDFILHQWIKEIRDCYWYIPSLVGIIQGEEHQTVGEHFTVAMINTLRDRADDYDEEFFSQFAHVIVDEGHVLASETFKTVLPRFLGTRLILTATPDRKDGLAPLFQYHAGGLDPVYVDVTPNMTSEWVIRRVPPIVDDSRMYKRVPGMRDRFGDPVLSLIRPKFDTAACSSDAMNQIVLNDVDHYLRLGKRIMVLGPRVEQLELLAQACEDSGVKAGLVTGNVHKLKDRLEAFKEDVMFITDKIAYKALDIPGLDTIINMFPTRDANFLRQAKGRGDRLKVGKAQPLFICYSHAYVRSLARVESDMIDVIKEIDPGAKVSVVNVRV